MSEKLKPQKKYYNLTLSETLFDELKVQAIRRDTTMLELIKRFMKFGLLTINILDDPNSSLIIREGDKETELKFY